MYSFSHNKSGCRAIRKVSEASVTYFCFAHQIKALVFFITPFLAMICFVSPGKGSPPTGPCPQLNGSLCGADICIWTGLEPSSWPWLQAKHVIYNIHPSPFLDLTESATEAKAVPEQPRVVCSSCLCIWSCCTGYVLWLFGLAHGSCSYTRSTVHPKDETQRSLASV